MENKSALYLGILVAVLLALVFLVDNDDSTWPASYNYSGVDLTQQKIV